MIFCVWLLNCLPQCSKSTISFYFYLNDDEFWLLGYSIESIAGLTGWRPYRLRQFHLDVSNTPANMSTTLRTRCYTDNTTEPHLPNSIIGMSCKQTARYVIVETTYDAPDDKSTGPMLEICEIEVYGMISLYNNILFNSKNH